MLLNGVPKRVSKSRFHASFSHKSRPEIAWNSCSRQVYPITLSPRLMYHAITQYFYPIHVFTLWNMPNNAITLFCFGGPWIYPSYIYKVPLTPLIANHCRYFFWPRKISFWSSSWDQWVLFTYFGKSTPQVSGVHIFIDSHFAYELNEKINYYTRTVTPVAKYSITRSSKRQVTDLLYSIL